MIARAVVVVIIVLGAVANPTCASPTNWVIGWCDHRGSVLGAAVGTKSYATDDYDLGVDSGLGDVPFRLINVGHFVRHIQGENWSGPTDWYTDDYRAPFAPNETKVWEPIYMWVAPDVSLSPLDLVFTPSTKANWLPPPDWSYKLCLDYVPPGIVYNGPWEWDISPTEPTWFKLPAYPSTIGTDGLRLHFTVTSIPEPASLAALGLALAALGFRKRRR